MDEMELCSADGNRKEKQVRKNVTLITESHIKIKRKTKLDWDNTG